MRQFKVLFVLFIIVAFVVSEIFGQIDRILSVAPVRKQAEKGLIYFKHDPHFCKASSCLAEEREIAGSILHDPAVFKESTKSGCSTALVLPATGFISFYTNHTREWEYDLERQPYVEWWQGTKLRNSEEIDNLQHAIYSIRCLAGYMVALDDEARALNWAPNPNDLNQMVLAMLLRAWREDRNLTSNERQVLDVMVNWAIQLSPGGDREAVQSARKWLKAKYGTIAITVGDLFAPFSGAEVATISNVNAISSSSVISSLIPPSLLVFFYRWSSLPAIVLAVILMVAIPLGAMWLFRRSVAGLQDSATGWKTVFGAGRENPLMSKADEEVLRSMSGRQNVASPPLIKLGQTVGISLSDRKAHTYVIGMTGTGKSKALESWIMQDIEAGRGVGVIDPHGTLIKNLLGRLVSVPNIADRLILIDPVDPEFVVGLNPLDRLPGNTYQSQAQSLAEIFAPIWYESWPTSTWLQEYTAYSAWAMAETGWSMLEIEWFLNDEEFRVWVMDRVKSVPLREWIEWYDARKTGQRDQETRSFLTRLRKFTAHQHLRPLIGQRVSTIDFREVLEAGDKILLVNLRYPKLWGDEAYRLLGSTVMTLIQLAALGRGDIGGNDRRRFYLYVDEFHTFANKTFVKLLGEIRKFGLTLTLANQNLKQLDTVNVEGLGDAVLGNCRNITSFRLGNKGDAEMVVHRLFTLTGMMTKEERQRWRSIAKTIPYRETDVVYYTLQEEQQFFMNILMGKGEEALADRDFVHKSGTNPAERDMTVYVPDSTVGKEVRDMIRASVEHQGYARPRDEVEWEINRRIHLKPPIEPSDPTDAPPFEDV